MSKKIQPFPGEIFSLQQGDEDGDLIELLGFGHIVIDSFRLGCEKHLLHEYGKDHPFKIGEIKHTFRRCIPLSGERGDYFPEVKRKTASAFPATVAKIL